MADNPNMRIYDAVRHVPDQAKKKINGGRLAGMTDINGMWRIKVLTEQFGPCGDGWYISDVQYWQDRMDKNESVALFCSILLHVKMDGAWSQPIYGIGGNMLVAAEKSGPRLDDEAYKKAYTDAISVACKALGIGADVYFEKDVTKYSDYEGESEQKEQQTHQQTAQLPAQQKPQQPAQQHPQQPAKQQQTAQQPKQTQPPKQPVGFDYRAALTQYRQVRQMTADQFACRRNACIVCGAVPDMRSADMTQRDWETLFRAIDERLGWAS